MNRTVHEQNTLPNRLQATRRSFGDKTGTPSLTPGDFSRRIGVPPRHYASCESGTSEPTFRLLAALHEKTGVSLDWLISGSA